MTPHLRSLDGAQACLHSLSGSRLIGRCGRWFSRTDLCVPCALLLCVLRAFLLLPLLLLLLILLLRLVLRILLLTIVFAMTCANAVE